MQERCFSSTHTTVNFFVFSILVCALDAAWFVLALPRPNRSPHPQRQRRGCLASKSSREGGTTAWSTPFTLAYFTNPGKAKMDFCPLPPGGCGISPNL